MPPALVRFRERLWACRYVVCFCSVRKMLVDTCVRSKSGWSALIRYHESVLCVGVGWPNIVLTHIFGWGICHQKQT